VLPLADYLETSLLKRPDRLQVRYPGELWHYTATSISRVSAPLVCSSTTDRYS
jgi:hypothetical protein